MNALTLLYAAVVGLLLTGAAAGIEAALRHRRRPARGVWVAAMIATLSAPLWGPALAGLRNEGATVPTAMEIREVLAEGTAAAAAAPSIMERTTALAQTAAALLAQPNRWLTLAWGLVAGFGLLLVLGALLRLRRRMDRWPRTRVGGDPVVLAPDFGPACIGLSRPRVVLPRWALGFGSGDLDLMLRHEQSHGRARDPLLLAGALATVALSPWNPALWWQLLRLRRAVELDCDRRVLATGASPAAYGGMLVAVLSRVRGGAFPAAALIEPASFLERRLTLMKTRTRIGLARTAGALALAGVLVALACETPAPDPVQPEMAAAPQEIAENSEQPLDGNMRLSSLSEGAKLYVDGVMVPSWELVEGQPEFPGFDPDAIARVEIVKGANEHAIRITTKDGLAAGKAHFEAQQTEELRPSLREREGQGQPAGKSTFKLAPTGEKSEILLREVPAQGTIRRAPSQEPLIYVDGERAEGGLKMIAELDVKGIDIIKGAAAEATYGPDARNGVVLVTTRGGGN